jgi:hypothetical protein
MTPRSPAEIRAEITRWSDMIREKRTVRERPRATPRGEIEYAAASIEGAAAAIIVSTLAWVLGEMASPTVRVKIK